MPHGDHNFQVLIAHIEFLLNRVLINRDQAQIRPPCVRRFSRLVTPAFDVPKPGNIFILEHTCVFAACVPTRTF